MIKNFEELATSQLRRDALTILEAGYSAINPRALIMSKVSLKGEELCIEDETYTCSLYERIFFVGIGKCGIDAAAAFEEILGDRITDGIVLDVRPTTLPHIRSFVGTHPYPSEANVSATGEIVKMLTGVTERDLVIVLISGGGSALLCLPNEMDCETLAHFTKLLMERGANIRELNTVRKHLSRIHGGNLAKLCYPAKVVSFILSDVPGNDISFIASGPTVMDTTSVADAEAVLRKYNLVNECQSASCTLIETPKEQKYFEKVSNLLLMTNRDALAGMQRSAENLGYHARILTDTLTGEARESGAALVREAKEPHECVLAAGETTVTVPKPGKGGRNQEMVLGALSIIPENVVFIAAASDGWDNSDVAGALGDHTLFIHAVDKSLDANEHLRENSSYTFFADVGGHIKTGRTGSNVADLFIVLRG